MSPNKSAFPPLLHPFAVLLILAFSEISIHATPAAGDAICRVDPHKGDDDNPRGKPWRTFGRLNKERLAPGDTVIIAAGHQEETLMPSGAGTADRPVVIRFLPGVHTIGMEKTIRMQMFISNSMDSTDPQPVGILLKNLRNFRLEGVGNSAEKPTILYQGRMAQIIIDHSENLTLTGLAFDLQRPTVSEFRVTETGPGVAEILVADRSDHAVENGKFVWKGDWGNGRLLVQEAIPTEGRSWRSRMPRGWDSNGQKEAKATDLGQGRVRLEYPSGESGLTKDRQYQFRHSWRDRVGVHNNRSRNIVFRDCDFHALTGMGFVSQFTENILYQRVNVMPPEGGTRTCAAWADIFHFSNCKGRILVDSCRLSGMQDDALNCHGTHLRIIGKPAENQLLLRFMHRQTYGFAAYQAGDEIAVISKDTLREYDGNPRRKVTAVERINDKEWRITLDGPAPDFKKDDVVDNITWYPDLTATNNHISMDPVRGFLITTRGKVLVENNTFHRPAMAGILIEDDASGWFESGPIRDMVIRNNRFVRCGISINPHTRSEDPGEPVHENIRIEGNHFTEGGRITARNVKGLAILHNKSPDGPVRVETTACTDVVEKPVP